MDVKLRNVGNSLTATIPKEFVISLHLKSGDTISIEESNGALTLTPKKKKLRGEAFLEQFYGKPVEEIGMIDTEVVETGAPVGGEVW